MKAFELSLFRFDYKIFLLILFMYLSIYYNFILIYLFCSILPTTLDSGFPGNTTDLPHTRISGPNTPTSIDVGPRFPPTPGVSSEGCRFQIPSSHTPSTSSTGKHIKAIYKITFR